MTKILFSVLLFPLLSACQLKQNAQKRHIKTAREKVSSIIYRIPELTLAEKKVIDINVPEKIEEPRTDIARIVKYIVLETTNDFLIGSIDFMEVLNNRIYILDLKTNSVNIFTIEGKFVKRIHDVGSGPKEYIDLSSMYISEANKYIVLYDPQRKNFLYYDLDGEFIETKRALLWMTDFSIFDTGEFCYYIEKQYGNFAEVLMTDKNIIPQKKLIRGIKPDKSLNFYSSEALIKDYQNKKLIMPILRDTVYEFTPTSFNAKYALKYEGKSKPKNYSAGGLSSFLKVAKQDKFCYSLGDFFENDDFVGFSIQQDGNEFWPNMIYCKKTNKSFFGVLEDEKTGMQIGLFPLKTKSNELYIGILPATIHYVYNNYKDIKNLPAEFINLAKVVKKYDNPVIGLVEMENF